eukprot:4204092-Lingulodinium_polyedra.AAC.1
MICTPRKCARALFDASRSASNKTRKTCAGWPAVNIFAGGVDVYRPRGNRYRPRGHVYRPPWKMHRPRGKCYRARGLFRDTARGFVCRQGLRHGARWGAQTA